MYHFKGNYLTCIQMCRADLARSDVLARCCRGPVMSSAISRRLFRGETALEEPCYSMTVQCVCLHSSPQEIDSFQYLHELIITKWSFKYVLYSYTQESNVRLLSFLPLPKGQRIEYIAVLLGLLGNSSTASWSCNPSNRAAEALVNPIYDFFILFLFFLLFPILLLLSMPAPVLFTYLIVVPMCKCWGQHSCQSWGQHSCQSWGQYSCQSWGQHSCQSWGQHSYHSWGHQSCQSWDNTRARVGTTLMPELGTTLMPEFHISKSHSDQNLLFSLSGKNKTFWKPIAFIQTLKLIISHDRYCSATENQCRRNMQAIRCFCRFCSCFIETFFVWTTSPLL